MAHNVTLIPGDGIGPEVIGAAVRVLEATNVNFSWDCPAVPAPTEASIDENQVGNLLDSVKKNGIAFKGPTASPPTYINRRSLHVLMRRELDLFACLRPAKPYPGVQGGGQPFDVVVFRENTEDVYCGQDKEIERDQQAEGVKRITRKASERIVRFAFEYARRENRQCVTAVHKADLLKATDGLFLKAAYDVAQAYPDITFEENYVDNLCVDLIRKPQRFDLMVMPNQYGDIVSGVVAGLMGGLGMAPGANIGDDVSVFEATHGVASKYAGQNKANPTAAILSGVLLLKHLGETAAASRLEKAVSAILAEGKFVTYDLKPTPNDPTAVGTQEMADAVIRQLQSN